MRNSPRKTCKYLNCVLCLHRQRTNPKNTTKSDYETHYHYNGNLPNEFSKQAGFLVHSGKSSDKQSVFIHA